MLNHSTSVIFSFAVSTFILSALAGCKTKVEWPESGKLKIVAMVKQDNFAFDCYPSKWVKENKVRLNELANLSSLGTNGECEFNTKEIVWTAFPNVLNATLRCEKSEIIGEYTVSVFQVENTSYGDYFCNTAHFDSSETYAIGSVTDKLEFSE